MIIGLTGPDDYGSTLEAAEKVLREKKDAVGYSIAWDVGSKNYDRWMAVERDQGWPWSFIVDGKGRLAYCGHPEHMDQALQEILAGTYDLDHAAGLYAQRLKAIDAAHELHAAVEAKKWTETSAIFERMVRLDSQVAAPRAAALYRKLLATAKEPEMAARFGGRVVDEWFHDENHVLTDLAGAIVDPEKPLEPQDLDLALKAARRAVELTHSQQVWPLTTLARALFLKGDRAGAVENQDAALKLADSQDQPEIRKALEEYRKAGR